jgi:hypothetical protein
MVVPRDGSEAQLLTSRVGITLTDAVDVFTITDETFIIRPLAGEALEGKYTVSENIVNFCPSESLAEGTTYEIVVPAGGIKDFSGNGVGEEFKATFTTAGETAAKSPVENNVRRRNTAPRIHIGAKRVRDGAQIYDIRGARVGELTSKFNGVHIIR